LSPRRRVRAKLPGCHYPDVAAQRAQRGAEAQVRPHPSNSGYLPLALDQTDDIPVHLRRLVALRDQGCQHPGGYFL
jgi:hypothetical protein